ncbi:M13 family metallopeptidase [Solicola sp. PLA-1-18]|uniref:M13 family metallopeptidase n=1 Tax=Solicola sp. PLA-1-18 TaxID=3380532 RepID=UPI003B7AB041
MLRSGIDHTHVDPAVRVQDDLYRHVNGGWLDTAQIPADRATAGSFVTLVDEAEAQTRAIIEEGRDARATTDDAELAKIGALYASFMDTDRVEELGAAPLADDLARVEAIGDVAGFVRTLGGLERTGVAGVIGMYVAPDQGDPEHYVVSVLQAGLGLPDESYYREDGFADARAAYEKHVAAMLDLAGVDDAPARAARILALETLVAQQHWDRVACRDAQKTYNPTTFDELVAAVPSFDWATWADAAGIERSVLDRVVVRQPSYLSGLDTLLTDEHLEAWRDWLRWQVVHSAAPYLSSAFVEANFDFYGRTLSGTDELRARWKRGVGFVERTMGEAVGKVYVARHFPPAAKERMDALIVNLVDAYRHSIGDLTWMSQTTKARALDKLEAFTPKVAHPVRWRDYSALEVRDDDLLGNVRSALAFELDHELSKLKGPVDRDEWYMTPQTVNAYYNPTMNEIVFPAAILQPPFFDAEADDAVNYGAIGAVIGHEIGHGFDDQGSHYDGTGKLSNWWTDDDRAAFDALTQRLVDQYGVLSPEGTDGRTVNGELTIGENIGDLGGLSIAYKAYALALDGAEAAVIDDLTGDQRFFMSWAQAWRSKVRDAESIRRLTVDPHSPPEFRCNQVVRNIAPFYDAFGVGESDELWLDPADRVTIW